MILETALADALYLNWVIPLAALPVAPLGLRYDDGAGSVRGGGGQTFFSLVLFRQIGLHLRGASWFALSYPQVDARLYVRDAASTPAVLLLRQLVPGWVVPIGRLVGGQPFSAAVCEFPHGLPRGASAATPEDPPESPREWRWKFSAGARLSVTAQIAAGPGVDREGQHVWAEEAAFFRDRTRAFWRRGTALRRVETVHPVTSVLPVRARIHHSDWLETFLPFAPEDGWSAIHSAFLVPRVQHVFSFDAARDLPVAAPIAAAG